MSGRYAKKTDVPVSKSKADIEAVLRTYGADAFMAGQDNEKAFIGFRLRDRHVKFILPLPDRNAQEITHHASGQRTAESAHRHWEQACRSSWRALLLSIKAKLEAVEIGITTFDDEFMAHLVLPDGQTVGQFMRPQIALAYDHGEMPPLLPDYTQ